MHHSALLLSVSLSTIFFISAESVSILPSGRQTTADDYITFTSGTCEDNGHYGIYNHNECKASATIYGWKWGFTSGDDYKDVVNGCSLRAKSDLFSTREGTCKIGHATPTWIPGLNGKANCQCSDFQPCLCRRKGIRSIAVTSGTCEKAGYKSIYDFDDCKMAANYLNYKIKFSSDDDYKDVVNGCSARTKVDLFSTPKGTCVVGHSTPLWIPGLNGKADCKCSDFHPCICRL